MDESNFKERRAEVEIRERLVRVEESARTAAEQTTKNTDLMKELSSKVDGLIAAARSQKSFLGGIVFVMTAIWAVIIFARDWIVNHLK